MIVSASYKTDIPTFYGEWFSNRLRAGYCKTVNPYSNRISRMSLRPGDVDGFVFWTKNVGPFLDRLAEVHALGVPFVVQHTINGYPRALEQAVVDAGRAVEHVRRIADRYGPRVCVWRYDTILNTSLTPREFHLDTFARLAADLKGATDEVVISFAHVYKKTLRNVNAAAREFGFEWSDPDAEWKRRLAGELAGIAAAQLPPPRPGRGDEFADFRGVTADTLRAFQARRLEALEHVANAFPGNPNAAKTPFVLPDLAG